MSKSIRLYEAFTGRGPTPAQALRQTAAKLRKYAGAILARAQEIEESADTLEGKRPSRDISWTGPDGDAWIAAGGTKD